MAKFATILKTLRTEHSLSQSALAERLGISKSAVSMYEHGRREPDFQLLGKIADFFQVDIDALLGHSGPTTVAAHLDTDDLSQDELDDVARYIEFIRSKRNV